MLDDATLAALRYRAITAYASAETAYEVWRGDTLLGTVEQHESESWRTSHTGVRLSLRGRVRRWHARRPNGETVTRLAYSRRDAAAVLGGSNSGPGVGTTSDSEGSD
jgi:hypothetical protein